MACLSLSFSLPPLPSPSPLHVDGLLGSLCHTPEVRDRGAYRLTCWGEWCIGAETPGHGSEPSAATVLPLGRTWNHAVGFVTPLRSRGHVGVGGGKSGGSVAEGSQRVRGWHRPRCGRKELCVVGQQPVSCPFPVLSYLPFLCSALWDTRSDSRGLPLRLPSAVPTVPGQCCGWEGRAAMSSLPLSPGQLLCRRESPL